MLGTIDNTSSRQKRKPTIDKILGDRNKGHVHYTNVTRLQLHSATLYGEEVLLHNSPSGTSLPGDVARGVRALRVIEGTSNATMLEIIDNIYNSIAFILEAKS